MFEEEICKLLVSWLIYDGMDDEHNYDLNVNDDDDDDHAMSDDDDEAIDCPGCLGCLLLLL